MTTTATTEHTCHGAVFCGQAPAAAAAECPACRATDHADDASLPVDVRAARAWRRAGLEDGTAEVLRMAVRHAVDDGDMDAAQEALDTLLGYADPAEQEKPRPLLEVLAEHAAAQVAKRAAARREALQQLADNALPADAPGAWIRNAVAAELAEEICTDHDRPRPCSECQ